MCRQHMQSLSYLLGNKSWVNFLVPRTSKWHKQTVQEVPSPVLVFQSQKDSAVYFTALTYLFSEPSNFQKRKLQSCKSNNLYIYIYSIFKSSISGTEVFVMDFSGAKRRIKNIELCGSLISNDFVLRNINKIK